MICCNIAASVLPWHSSGYRTNYQPHISSILPPSTHIQWQSRSPQCELGSLFCHISSPQLNINEPLVWTIFSRGPTAVFVTMATNSSLSFLWVCTVLTVTPDKQMVGFDKKIRLLPIDSPHLPNQLLPNHSSGITGNNQAPTCACFNVYGKSHFQY